MDILIISHFGSTYSDTDNDRFLYLAKELAKKNDVEIVTSSFCHEKKIHRSKAEKEWTFKITFLEEPGYKKNVCLKRFYSHFKWGRKLKNYLNNRKKPDVIYCAIPSLTGPRYAMKYCKKNNVRYIVDVQDLWPESFQMVINVPVISNMFFYPFKIFANSIYKQADAVVAVSKTYVERVLSVNKSVTEGLPVFLGTNIDEFDSNIKPNNFLSKNSDEIWLAYCGTLGTSYDISCVIDALALLKSRKCVVPKFIVMGDGPYKEKFEAYANEQKIDALFLGRVPYNRMCSILSQCDITINPIVGSSVASIINKHADYAASGLPVINTQNSNEYKALVDLYRMGINVESGNKIKVATAIQKLCDDSNLRIRLGTGARKCAMQQFDRKTTYKKIINLICKWD